MNFLQNMQIPQLGSPSFSTEFPAFCNAIKENFERLISVQYTRGADGNSVVTRTITIDAGLANTDNVSPLGYAIISSLFPPAPGVSIPTTVVGINDYLENSITGVAPLIMGGTHHCLPEYVPDPATGTPGLTLTLVVDDHNGRAFLASPLVFIDGRIADLSDLASTMTNPGAFHDYSALVYGAGVYHDAPLIYNSNISSSVENQDPTKPETWAWDNFADPNAYTIRLDVIPKLYYDDVIGEFCWLINGQKTHITAQGIKGDPGDTPKIIVAKGSPETGNPLKINLMEIENIDPSGQTISWERFDPLSDRWKFRDGDLALIFYKDDINIRHAFLGTVHWNSAGTQAFALKDASGDDNIFDAISSQKFRNELLSIDRDPGGSYDPFATVRGLFVPAVLGAPTSNPGYVHMTYAEHNIDSVSPTRNISRLHSAVTPQGATYYDNGPQTPDPASLQGYVGDWIIDYNIGVQGNMETFHDLSVQGNATIQGNTFVQGNLDVQGNIRATNFTAEGVRGDAISGHLGVVTTFKDIKYSFVRQADYVRHTGTGATQQVTMDGLGYIVATSAVMNIKIGIVSDCENNPYGNAYGVQNNSSMVNLMMEQYEGAQGTQGWSSNSASGITSVQNRYGAVEPISGLDPSSSYELSLPYSPKMYDVVEYNIPIQLNGAQSFSAGDIHWANDSYFSVPSAPPFKYIASSVNGATTADICTYTLLSPKSQLSAQEHNPFIRTNDNTPYANDQSVQRSVYSPMKIFKGMKTMPADTYDFKGILHYEPFNIDVKYNINLKCFIYDMYPSGESKSIRTYLTVMPYGYLQVIKDTTNYYAPVYGNISVRGYHPRPANDHVYSWMDNQTASSGSRYAYDYNMDEKYDTYQRFNGIVYEKLTHEWEDELRSDGCRFDGSYDMDTSFMSLFERYDSRRDTGYGRIKPSDNFESRYIQLTANLRLYDANTKICASNTWDGAILKNTNEHTYLPWASNDPIYICALQRRGRYGDSGQVHVKNYIEDTGTGDHLGTNNFWDIGVYDAEHDLSVKSMLFYPYSPALVKLDNNGNPIRTSDPFSGTPYYEGGRILGNTNQPTTAAQSRIVERVSSDPTAPSI